MSDVQHPSRVTVTIHRVELRRTGAPDESENETQWSVLVGEWESGVVVVGYVRKAGEDSLGQAQGIASIRNVDWSEITVDADSKNEFIDWLRSDVLEMLYDTLRRTLEMNAAMMDTQLDIDLASPNPDVQFMSRSEAEAHASE